MEAAARGQRAIWEADSRPLVEEILAFLLDRLRVQLRAEGARHDLVAASIGDDDDILRILARAAALQSLAESETGTNLLAAYKRAQNILRIEEKKDGPHDGPVDEAALVAPEEQALNAALAQAAAATKAALAAEDFPAAMAALAALRAPTDAFFDRILVNDPDRSLRLNRLRLLSRLRATMDAVADISKIEA
ncbi:MAG: DALR anticodon-binding domain-containing protein [Rubritepida sp.]|nr:DALR anticodon-binding domain-containing protein [Rubritepida sp.]